jgi:hypothetical protein
MTNEFEMSKEKKPKSLASEKCVFSKKCFQHKKRFSSGSFSLYLFHFFVTDFALLQQNVAGERFRKKCRIP